jgi:hypothetical protein
MSEQEERDAEEGYDEQKAQLPTGRRCAHDEARVTQACAAMKGCTLNRLRCGSIVRTLGSALR